MTFMPGDPGKMIEVEFFGTFQIESCSWDWLRVYDGTDAGAVMIAEFCGSTNPTEALTATNPDGALTFVFHTDGSVTYSGWSANISCVSQGNIAAVNSEICLGSSTGNITYSGYFGTITDWQKRLDNGSWVSTGFTGSTFSETPSEPGMWQYRAVTDGTSYSDVVAIEVYDVTAGGDVSGGYGICEGESTGTLTLSGHTGSVIRWQKQLDGGSWTDISNTNTTYSETPSSAGTWTYRAVVQSGICSEENSGTTEVVVTESASEKSYLIV